MQKFHRHVSVVFFLSFISICFSQTLILVGENPSAAEQLATNDLAMDISRVCGERVFIHNYDEKFDHKGYEKQIIVGTVKSNALIAELADKLTQLKHDLENETFIIETVTDARMPTLVIAGADDRGVAYGIYEFCDKVLGVDAFEYWTDKKPIRQDGLTIPDISFRKSPPVFPYRGYFDNDNDMIANWKGEKLIVEFDTWRHIIDSLYRIGYNYIDIHDTLGRSEFSEWAYYQNLTDNHYHADLDLINKIIDYAHAKGMMIQIPLTMGWEFAKMDEDKLCLSEHYEDWMHHYRHYLKYTPIGKCDLFFNSPRHPFYDWAYSCDEESPDEIGALMTKMFNGLYDTIKEHNPDAILYCNLWRDGRELWNADEFLPNKNIQMLWADYGVADFREWPDELKGYPFGIYIHAGVWMNHVTQDPYPEDIKAASMEALKRGMTNNYFVNGQDFKTFILNIEACVESAWDPVGFDPEEFYTNWTTRYFGDKASTDIVRILKLIHKANKSAAGFKDVMQETVFVLWAIEGSGCEKRKVSGTDEGIKYMLQVKDLADKTICHVPESSLPLYDDQIAFPVKIYLQNLELHRALLKLNNMLAKSKEPDDEKAAAADLVLEKLIEIRKTLTEGSKWSKWNGWTHPDNFRVYTPPPKIEYVQAVMDAVKTGEPVKIDPQYRPTYWE